MATVRAGLARGLNFVDTAPNYAAEEFIGTALRRAALPAGGAPPGGGRSLRGHQVWRARPPEPGCPR